LTPPREVVSTPKSDQAQAQDQGGDSKLTPVKAAEPAPELTPPREVVSTPKSDQAQAQDQGGDSNVRRASLPEAADEPLTPAPPAETGEWAEVRKSMRALGVSRYGIDGEPGGRVRFHCVIPLAGRRAVSQHFEAEADDDLQAARAALKRVALWKATDEGAASGR
jgi:hypothetical protein